MILISASLQRHPLNHSNLPFHNSPIINQHQATTLTCHSSQGLSHKQTVSHNNPNPTTAQASTHRLLVVCHSTSLLRVCPEVSHNSQAVCQEVSHNSLVVCQEALDNNQVDSLLDTELVGTEDHHPADSLLVDMGLAAVTDTDRLVQALLQALMLVLHSRASYLSKRLTGWMLH
jgi:hypothetical protein